MENLKTILIWAVFILVAVGILNSYGVFTGKAATDIGSVKVTVNANIDVQCLDCGTVFGNLSLGSSHHTLNFTAQRMKINNSGNTVVDIDIYANKPLFNRTCKSGSRKANYTKNNCFQVYCNSSLIQESPTGGIASSNPGCNFNYINKWRDMPIQSASGSTTNQESIVENLTRKANFSVDINVTVPNVEPAGVKNSTITFVGGECSNC